MSIFGVRSTCISHLWSPACDCRRTGYTGFGGLHSVEKFTKLNGEVEVKFRAAVFFFFGLSQADTFWEC